MKHRQRAFTLLEMMITVTILALLVVVGVPGFEQFLRQQAMKAAVASLHNDLLLARSRAVYEDLSTVVCPGSPQSGCTGHKDWSDGWIVFADRNADRQKQEDEPLIRLGMAVNNLSISSSNGRKSFRFFPDGSAPGSNGSIRFCGLDGPASARKLVISNLGRIRRDKAPTLPRANCP